MLCRPETKYKKNQFVPKRLCNKTSQKIHFHTKYHLSQTKSGIRLSFNDSQTRNTWAKTFRIIYDPFRRQKYGIMASCGRVFHQQSIQSMRKNQEVIHQQHRVDAHIVSSEIFYVLTQNLLDNIYIFSICYMTCLTYLKQAMSLSKTIKSYNGSKNKSVC